MKVDMRNVLTSMMKAWSLQLLFLRAENHRDLELADLGLRKWLNPDTDWKQSFEILDTQIPDTVLFFERDVFELNYALFRLPQQECLACIGPWLTEHINADTLSWPGDLGKKEDLPQIRHFYQSVRVIDQVEFEQSLAALIACCFPGQTMQIRHMREAVPFTMGPVRPAYPEPIFWNMLTIERLEQQWLIREKILREISEGRTNEAITLVRQHKDFRFFRPWTGIHYSEQMDLLMTNAIFMETAGRAQAHPVYIQEVFEQFADRIRNQYKVAYHTTVQEMIREYCACIQRWSLAQYSEPVRIATDYMRFHLKENPVPAMLAEKSGLSLRQLNRRFRQETGMSMMEYLGRERIRAATIALEVSDQSIGQVAESVGIIDANYFSRIFRKYMGQTPSQYRKNLVRTGQKGGSSTLMR